MVPGKVIIYWNRLIQDLRSVCIFKYSREVYQFAYESVSKESI